MHKAPFSRSLMVALGLAALALLAGGAWFYRAQERALRREAEAELTAIAQLKVDQIAQWRAEQVADAAVSSESPFFIAAVARWLAAPQAEDTEQILARLRSLQGHFHYREALLVDNGGQVRLSLSGYLGPLHEDATQALAAALAGRQPVLSDLHSGPGDLVAHIDAIAPLFADYSETSESLGAVILQSDARQFLYPVIQSWPVPSDSAETLLVRRDGDEVLFLNDLRFQPGAALTLRLPLSQVGLPAVMAVQGQEGVVQGVDYRGVDVLAVLKAVPDSPWFLVAKVDAAEALSVVRRESTLILALLLGLVLASVVGVVALWQRSATVHYRALYAAESARRKAEQRHRVTIMSVGDGVIATDAEGRVELLNPVAEALTGWPQDEAHGRPLEEVFCIINEKTRQPVDSPASRVLREGYVVGLANHTLLIARDGSERPIADSGAPIRDEKGEISGMVLVFRDQAEERAAQTALQESETKYRSLVENISDVVYTLNLQGQFTYVSPAIERLSKYTPGELIGRHFSEFIYPDDLPGLLESFNRTVHGELEPYEYRILDRGGVVRYIRSSSQLIVAEGVVVGLNGVMTDITERKRAEDRIYQLNSELERRVEERTRELHAAQEQLIRQERLAVLGQLAGGVGHELRNPLGVISNSVYYLKLVLPDADDNIVEYLGIIENETRNAEKIVADLLDFSRIRSADREPVAPAELARQVLERYPAPAAVTVSVQAGAGLPLVYADPRQMIQVLGNLVVNAYQAMPQGGALTISAHGREGQVAIAVTDTGVGIPPENMSRIFEPLFTTKPRGIGLGLAVCTNLVEANDGRIEVQSEPGQGSAFSVFLPIVADRPLAAETENPNEQ